MDQNIEKIQAIHCERCKKALTERGFHAYIVKDAAEIQALVHDLVKDGDLVCDGGSMTLKECGVLAMLEKRNVIFQSHNDPNLSREKSDEEARKAFSADVFLASANAITENGEIINVDGHGNRVSAMIFGPKKVILVVGVNKLVEDEAAAIRRIHHVAAPMNSVRLHKDTPCAHVGSCQDCRSKDRICSSYVKLNYDKEDRIHVILSLQPFGY